MTGVTKAISMYYPVCGIMRVAYVATAGFLSHYLSGSLPYVSQCSTTGVTKAISMYYPVCGIMHIKRTLAANQKE